MTGNTQELEEILEGVANEYSAGANYENAKPLIVEEAKQSITLLIKELVEEAIGEDEGLVEVHKRNLVVASQFNAVIKSRNSLRHKQRQALKNLLKALEEV